MRNTDHHKNKYKENVVLNSAFSSIISQKIENRNKTKEEILIPYFYGIVLKSYVFQVVRESIADDFSQGLSLLSLYPGL